MKTYKSKKKCLFRYIFLFGEGKMLLLHLPRKRVRKKFIKNYFSGKIGKAK